MKVKDKFPNLFTEMCKYSRLEYAKIIPPLTMDLFYLSNYGERTLSSFAENNTVEDVSKTIITMFVDKWNTLYEMAISKIDIDYNYSEKQTETVEGTGENNYTLESVNTGSVNAYNDDDFVNDKQDQNNTTNTGSNSNTKNREYIKQVLSGSKTEYYNTIISHLQNNYFNDIIIRDINEFLTLSIFE